MSKSNISTACAANLTYSPMKKKEQSKAVRGNVRLKSCFCARKTFYHSVQTADICKITRKPTEINVT